MVWLAEAFGHLGSGAVILPPRTQAYHAHGATAGQRNVELLAAACRCRDAGMSESDAENTLIPRALADGLAPGEALAAVRSAFSKSAREPIQTSRLNTMEPPKLTPELRARIEA